MITHADHPKVRYLIIRADIINSIMNHATITEVEEPQPAEESQFYSYLVSFFHCEEIAI